MPQIKLYTRKMCGFCSAAKELLKAKGVSFRELDATFDRNLRAEMIANSNGGSTYPQIFIGENHVGGCDDLFALESSGKLDVMLKG